MAMGAIINVYIFFSFFYYKQKHNTNGMAKSGDTIQIGWEGWMAMEPEARIAPPEGNGEPLENMSGKCLVVEIGSNY